MPVVQYTTPRIVRKEIWNKSKQSKTIRYYIQYVEKSVDPETQKIISRKKKQLHGGFQRQKDAEVVRSRIMTEMANGTFGLPSTNFQRVAEEWLGVRRGAVGERTFEDYKQVVENHLIPEFGDKAIDEITLTDLVAFRDTKLEQLKPATVNKIRRYMKMIFRYAETDYIEPAKNPMKSFDKVKVDSKEMDYLGRIRADELDKFLEATTPEYYPLFFTAIWTGARESELFGLRWQDIDFDKATVHIWQQHDKFGFRDPKSGSSKRYILMSPDLAKVLFEHKKSLEEDGKPTGDNDIVFPNHRGRPHVASTVIREFDRTVKRAGLRDTLHVHCLRHTFGALTATMGAPPKFIQQEMGHSSITMTLDLYSHLMPSVFDDFGKEFDEFVRKFTSKA